MPDMGVLPALRRILACVVMISGHRQRLVELAVTHEAERLVTS
jgi:hypothetical protein